MDLLVVVGDVEVPSHLRQRSTHIIETEAEGWAPELVAHVRAHIPRTVGVVGSHETASALRKNGFAVTLFSDEHRAESTSSGST